MNADLISAKCILIADYKRCLYHVGLLLMLEFEKKIMKFCKKVTCWEFSRRITGYSWNYCTFSPEFTFFVTRFSLLCTLFAAVTVLLAMSVYQVIVNSILPSSNTVPVIGEYTQLLKTNNQNAPARKSRYPRGSRIFLFQNFEVNSVRVSLQCRFVFTPFSLLRILQSDAATESTAEHLNAHKRPRWKATAVNIT